MRNLLNRVKTGLHNKLWLFNRRLREMQIKVQFYWLLSQGSQPLDINSKSVIVFSPHQDDESLGCGGIIAQKREQGVPVKVVFVTDGGGSHSNNPNYTRSDIVQIRQEEALLALNILGVESKDIHFLNKRDGAMYKMTTTEQEQTIEEMVQLLRTFQPQEVYVTHKYDRSKDHEVTYQLVKSAIAKSEVTVDLWQYAIWLHWNSLLFRDLKFAELAGAHRVEIHGVQAKKKKALETYRSQYLPMKGDSSPLLPPGFLWRFFLPYEVFFKSDL